jgi:hypothetical protein
MPAKVKAEKPVKEKKVKEPKAPKPPKLFDRFIGECSACGFKTSVSKTEKTAKRLVGIHASENHVAVKAVKARRRRPEEEIIDES